MRKKSFIYFVSVFLIVAVMFTGCGKNAKDNKITIWTSGEDYKNDYYLKSLKEKFPDYDFVMEYMSSSNIAAKIMEEGNSCSCDVVLSEEYGYLNMCEEFLAELKDFDFSVFLDELVPSSHKFTPEVKNGGCVIVNNRVLEEKHLDVPESYDDLLKPCYRNLISMPSPASSGTGYMFLRQLTNEWGEDRAFDYFEKLTENILQYTSSGSGPVNALVQGEVAVGLGMTSQAVVEINDGVDLSIIFFKEGSPFSMYGNAVLKKSAERESVMEVFNYLATELARGDNGLYFPDQIFKDYRPVVKGFPTDIRYGNMSNDTRSEKERLLAKWKFS
ncbi:MAG: extracellular solute-binding protein [Sphaerochaetaceae bacterium]|nr:extracellular solute-binding protein [Sphaerochaetaceae bacterium]